MPAAVSSPTYNAANQLISWNGASLAYDLDGNLTGDGTSTYTWNARGQLTAISGGTAASFSYDAAGRRTNRTVAGTATSFAFDGANGVQEQVGGSPTSNQLTGGLDQTIRRIDAAGTRDLLTDALGSTSALVDTSGAISTSYTYEPYGATTVTGTTSTNPSQFTGRENDLTGLYYYRARYYSPATGRFISEDPAGFAAGDPNLYRYVGNDPINATDPSGLCGDCIGDIAFIAMDVWSLATGPRKDQEANMAALGLDILGLFIPGVMGLGHADDLARVFKFAESKVDDAFKHGDDAAGFGDDVIVVRGGTSDIPPPGEVFSGSYGRSVDEAAAAVPHGKIRVTTVGDIKIGGGKVTVTPGYTRSGALNPRHVDICLGRGPCPFGPLIDNPIGPAGRIK